MKAAPAIHFAVPVWGEAYVRTFLEYCLPTQLSAGNVPALSGGKSHRYVIYTTRDFRNALAESPAFRLLQRFLPTSVELIDGDGQGLVVSGAPQSTHYDLKSRCYRKALSQAAAEGAAVVLLNADIVLADGFISSVETLLAAGKRVVEVAGPRGVRGPIGRALVSCRRNEDGVSITISPRELSQLWLRHIHPLMEMHMVQGPPVRSFHPSHLYWRVGEEGILAHCFHLYPIVVYPRHGEDPAFTTTIDDDLVENLGFAADEIAIADDSREIFCCELSPLGHVVGSPVRRDDLQGWIKFYLSYGGLRNIEHFQHGITITGQNELGSEWRDVRARSFALVHDITCRYRAGLAAGAFMPRRGTAESATLPVQRSGLLLGLASRARRCVLDWFARRGILVTRSDNVLKLVEALTGKDASQLEAGKIDWQRLHEIALEAAQWRSKAD